MLVNRSKYKSAITPYLGEDVVVVLHGARQVGKTSLLYTIRDDLKAAGKTTLYLDLEYVEILSALNTGDRGLLSIISGEGIDKDAEVYVFIDEIQYIDNPSSLLKTVADHHKNIHLIVSGSSSFDIKSKFSDSLVGRTVNFEIYPLDFDEFLKFKDTSIDTQAATATHHVRDLQLHFQEYVRYGGYPKIVLENDVDKKKRYLVQIIDTYVRKDIRDLANIEDIGKFNDLLYVLAKQSGELLNMQSLSKETGVSFVTLKKYLHILEETYVIKRIRPYSKSPSVEISKNPKVYFYDSGLQSLLWKNNFQDYLDGNIIETAIFGELVKKVGVKNIRFWRTKQQNEVDFVVDNGPESQLKAIEVKTDFKNFNRSKIEAFLRQYPSADWTVTAIEGDSSNNNTHPWQLKKFLLQP